MEPPSTTNRRLQAAFRVRIIEWLRLHFWTISQDRAAFAEIFSMAAIGSAFGGIVVPVIIVLATIPEAGVGVLLAIAPAAAMGMMIAIFFVFPFALLVSSPIFLFVRPRAIYAVCAGLAAITVLVLLLGDFSIAELFDEADYALLSLYVVAAMGAWVGHFITFRFGYRRAE